MISFEHKGDFSKLKNYLQKAKNFARFGILHKYGREGVAVLASATPVDTGKTAASWSYKIEEKNGSVSLAFYNSNINDSVPIAIIIQYGHGTGTGGWVEGIDYINPAIQPVFNRLAEAVWREVTKV